MAGSADEAGPVVPPRRLQAMAGHTVVRRTVRVRDQVRGEAGRVAICIDRGGGIGGMREFAQDAGDPGFGTTEKERRKPEGTGRRLAPEGEL